MARVRDKPMLTTPPRLTLLAVWLCLAGAAQAAPTLKLSALPDEGAAEQQRRYAPLTRYLSAELKLKVQFVPLPDYTSVAEALGRGKVDLAWLGGFSYVQARQLGEVRPIAQRDDDPSHTSVFIAHEDSGVRHLKDLRGKNFAFGAQTSAAGHLMPRWFLQRDGLRPDSDFHRLRYSGSHEVTALWVASGKMDAGVLGSAGWQRLQDSNKLDLSEVRVIATTPAYSEYNWSVRPRMPAALRDKLTRALLKLDMRHPGQRDALEALGAQRLIPAQVEQFLPLEQAARSAGMLDKKPGN